MRGYLVNSPGKGQEKEFKAEWVEVLGESNAEVREGRAAKGPAEGS